MKRPLHEQPPAQPVSQPDRQPSIRMNETTFFFEAGVLCGFDAEILWCHGRCSLATFVCRLEGSTVGAQESWPVSRAPDQVMYLTISPGFRARHFYGLIDQYAWAFSLPIQAKEYLKSQVPGPINHPRADRIRACSRCMTASVVGLRPLIVHWLLYGRKAW